MKPCRVLLGGLKGFRAWSVWDRCLSGLALPNMHLWRNYAIMMKEKVKHPYSASSARHGNVDVDAICTCNDNEVLLYLKDAVQKQDLERVIQTLRGRDLRFANMVEKLSRDLDELRREYGELKRKYEACLKREGLVSELHHLKNANANATATATSTSTFEECHTPQVQVLVQSMVTTPRITNSLLGVRRTLHFSKQDNYPGPENAISAEKCSGFYHSTGMEVCKTIHSDNSVPKGVVRNVEKKENERAHLQSDSMDIVNALEVVSKEANLGSSNDGLQCSFSTTKTDLIGVSSFTRHNPIVISDTESENSGTSLTKKSICKKVSCTPKTQTSEVEVETQSSLHTAGSSPDGEHSGHNEEQQMQTSAKTKRGYRAVVLSESESESESDSNEAGFSCKRRKWKRLGVGTQGNGIHGTHAEGPREDEVVIGFGEPYERTSGSGRNLGKEDLLSNEEAEAVPDVKLKRIHRIKDVNQLSTTEHSKENMCSIQGKPDAVMEFRGLQAVKEGSELYNAGKFKDGMCSVDGAPVAKYRRLKRVLEASGPEKSKVGKTFADMQDKITLDPDVNDVQNHNIFSNNGDYKASVGATTCSIASTMKSAGDGKLAEVFCEPPICSLNSRTRRNHPRKMINLMKESDGEDDEDEHENDSQVEDLGGFIVDGSVSGTDSECSSKLKGSTSDSLNTIGNLDSDTDSSSAEDLNEVIRKISRQNKSTSDWKYEGEMLAAFAKDNVLCMRAVCALYRQQTNEEKSGKSSLYLNRRGFDKTHALRGSLLAEFLTENDPFGPVKKSVEDLKKHDSKGVQYCTDLAIHHSKQLFQICRNNEDPHFPYT